MSQFPHALILYASHSPDLVVLFSSSFSGGRFELLPRSHRVDDLSGVTFAVDILFSPVATRHTARLSEPAGGEKVFSGGG